MIAAIYSRKSTEQAGVADDQKSVSRQIEHARAYAMRKGWTVADEYVYVDDGISGAEFANRPGFIRLMNALKPRPVFQVLVMSEESRLGREAIETAYALKQLVTAGVRVFFYLEDRERTLDSPTDKIMLSLTAFADELEREKARQRTYDAMLRKAKAGHVTGGRVFGYENVDVVDAAGQRSHVERRILEPEADVVREIFNRYVAGAGVRTIAHALNDERRPCPRAQQGRPSGWAPSSVWEALHRSVYRGEIVWNTTRKRNRWGAKASTAKRELEWVRVSAPALRIIPEPLWLEVQARAAAAKATYGNAAAVISQGGRPTNPREARHLLTGFTQCAACGASMLVHSRSHGSTRGRWRAFAYACSAFHRRGRSVCANSLEVRVERADDAILTEIEQFVLHPDVVNRAIELALEELQPSADRRGRAIGHLERELRQATTRVTNLTAAIAAGAELAPLLTALRQADQERLALEAQLANARRPAIAPALTAAGLRHDVLAKVAEWRATLRQDARSARAIVRQLLEDRVVLTPRERGGERFYAYMGRFTIGGLFSGEMCPQVLASPTATGRLWTIERSGVIAA